MALKFSLNSLPWRLQLGASAVISAACVGAFWYLYAVPARADIDDRTKALKKVQAEIGRGLKTARRLPEFRKEVAGLEAQLAGLRTQLPEEQDVADLLRRVQAMATESNLTIRGFTPQPVTRKDLHAEWPIALELDGTYHNLAAFFDRLGKFARIVNISNLDVKGKAKGDSRATINASCIATTFVLLDKPAPKKGTAASPAAPATKKVA